ncbi:MAG TPA: phage head closure protein [Hyphomicrobiales bacterium]|nr:phage head closure protein [Hyphomicrobiales bacterium]
MSSDDIRLGRLRHRVTILAPVETDDGAGGVVRSWSAAGDAWAAIEPVSAAARYAAAQAGQTVTHRIVMRPPAALTTQHRLQRGTSLYEPRSFLATASERFVLVLAEEMTA